jgi:hypothetical protein
MISKKIPSLLLALLLLVFSPTWVAAADEPDVDTRDATEITEDTALLRGRVDGNGAATTVWFEYGQDRSLDDSTNDKRTGSGTSNFSAEVTDLEPGVIYYFRAVAENDEGIDYGSIYSFRTFYSIYFNNQNYNNSSSSSPRIPQAFTEGASDVGSYSAQLNSLITNNNNDFSNAWFEWGTSPALGYQTVKVSLGSLPEARHADILSGLRPNTIYYFRAVAENSYWRSFGTTLNFVTGSGLGGTTLGSNTNTIIIREPVIIEQVPSENTDPEVKPAEDDSSSLGASAIMTNTFLPQSLIGWIVLVVLFLVLVWLVRNVFQPKTRRAVVIEHTVDHL